MKTDLNMKDWIFTCTVKSELVDDDFYCKHKSDGGYGCCENCKNLRIQMWKGKKLVQEYYSDFTPSDITPEEFRRNFMLNNPDFLEIGI